MSIKNKMIITKRIDIKENMSKMESLEEIHKEEYLRLKDKLKTLTTDDIYNKIETAKILNAINQKKLYILDGYKNFYSFLADFKIAKSQAYKYIKIVSGVEKGIIDYNFIANNGIEKTIKQLESNNVIKKSRQNPIKPLRFQLKKQESYDFYKKNGKFTGFLLEELLESQTDLINKLLKKYKQLKGY
ncbi:chromosome replication/partitioning protein [Borreliella burgdorferi]|uniref:PF-49 protein n=6 Tax=Borreliella burgdorferi TaxID=139 RepID=H7C7Q6_BORBU|nr:chromosome replication/partitioning protein [Borreliella burgdorferi]AAC34958.1 unknown [Borreliella burgdorferi 297]AAF07674.1 PF-49 protein [Borreliella burgdorferi B31]AAF29794.1 ORF22 [Borreliella burgdorferi]AAN17886.1 PF-49 protein [Borreliella burgdorferi]ACK75366.1 putative plasmid partition protein [Borreliella burgdorferi ZS7]